MEKHHLKKISQIALGVTLALGITAGAVTPATVHAQNQEERKPPKVSKPVSAVLAEAQKLFQANDFAGALAKAREAEALPKRTKEDDYVIASFERAAAARLNDFATIERTSEAMLASGIMSPEEEQQTIRILAQVAARNNNDAKAISQYQRLIQLQPNDTEAYYNIAALAFRSKQLPLVVPNIRKAIELSKAAGTKPPETWYGLQLQAAYDAKLTNEMVPAAIAFVTAYPNPKNWSDAIEVLNQTARFDDNGVLDVYRLSTTVGAMKGEDDYLDYADTALRRGLPGEAKYALDQGIAKGMVTASKPQVKELLATASSARVNADRASLAGLEADARKRADGKLAANTADGYLSHQNWAKAAELYQLALQKGGAGVDTALVNTRLGIALAKAGRKAEAEAAFKAVTSGPRQTLAQYWLAWLSQQA